MKGQNTYLLENQTRQGGVFFPTKRYLIPVTLLL